MNKITHYIIMCIAIAMLAGCGKSGHKGTGAYNLSVQLDKGLKGDTAQLFIVEDGYNRLLDGGIRTGKAGTPLVWKGHIDGVRVAFVKWQGNDRPFYFVLEPGKIDIAIHRHSWIINGGKHNGHYTHFLLSRQAIINERDSIFKQYLKHAGDSTLTQVMEQTYLERDSLLADSLNRYMTWRMSRKDPVATIVRERFGHTLPSKLQQNK